MLFIERLIDALNFTFQIVLLKIHTFLIVTSCDVCTKNEHSDNHFTFKKSNNIKHKNHIKGILNIFSAESI